VTEPDGAAARDIAAIIHELMKLENKELLQSADHEIMEKAASA
jgi:hypothetical protein